MIHSIVIVSTLIELSWKRVANYFSMMALFFFFQAEDGIRDVAVTGVQTCALPISGAAPGHLPDGRAAVVPGREAARGDARGAEAHPAGARSDDSLRHPRPDGSHDDGLAHRRPRPRPPGAARQPPGDLRGPGQHPCRDPA